MCAWCPWRPEEDMKSLGAVDACGIAVLWVLGAEPMFSVTIGPALYSLKGFNYYFIAITNHFRLETNKRVST